MLGQFELVDLMLGDKDMVFEDSGFVCMVLEGLILGCVEFECMRVGYMVDKHMITLDGHKKRP